MGTSATKSKQRWNSANYTQIKAYVAPEIASAFKVACVASGTSMNSELTQFMSDYCGTQKRQKVAKDTDFLSTSKKRRKKFDELLYQLKQLRDAQENANENVHENFRSTTNFEESLERVTKMDEAIDILDDIY